MLENPPPPPPSDSPAAVKRYAPPNQRNRLNRRKSGDRFDRTNNALPNDGVKNQQAAISRNVPVLDHGGFGGSNSLNENFRLGLIPLEGCCHSEASQLLNDRWASVIRSYDDTSIDLSERPVMYPGTWDHFRLPHQLMPPANSGGPSTGSQMDFLSELRRAMQNANHMSSN